MGAQDGAVGRLRTFARDELLRKVASARSQVRLASPFITRPIAEALAISATASAVAEKRLLTALVAGSVRARALDPAALGLLKGAGWLVRSIRNLHAKVGWSRTMRSSISRPCRRPQTERRWKRVLGPLEIADPAVAQKLLGDRDPKRRYWVKANYHRRNADGRGWWHRGWISDWRRASYRPGDLILLYLGAKYDGPRSCPAIVRVISESRHDPEFMATHGDPAAKDRWPYVTDVECVFEVPVSRGVPLEAFDVTSSGLQGGYRELSRAQLEIAVEHLLSAAKTE